MNMEKAKKIGAWIVGFYAVSWIVLPVILAIPKGFLMIGCFIAGIYAHKHQDKIPVPDFLSKRR